MVASADIHSVLTDQKRWSVWKIVAVITAIGGAATGAVATYAALKKHADPECCVLAGSTRFGYKPAGVCIERPQGVRCVVGD
jgi:hypothetical protein